MLNYPYKCKKYLKSNSEIIYFDTTHLLDIFSTQHSLLMPANRQILQCCYGYTIHDRRNVKNLGGGKSILVGTKDTTLKICNNRRLVLTSFFAIFVITFEQIEVQTHSVPQNDLLNLSFGKDFYVDERKLARNGQKKTIYIS